MRVLTNYFTYLTQAYRRRIALSESIADDAMMLRICEMLPRDSNDALNRDTEYRRYNCRSAALYAFGIGTVRYELGPIPYSDLYPSPDILQKYDFQQISLCSLDRVTLVVMRDQQEYFVHAAVGLGVKSESYVFHKPDHRVPEITTLEHAYNFYNKIRWNRPLTTEFWQQK